MGGYMTYQRLRTRNDILPRKPDDDPDPYWRDGRPRTLNWHGVCGDMNRMERDYLTPGNRWGGLSPADECADALGIDVRTVREVLRYVFLEQA